MLDLVEVCLVYSTSNFKIELRKRNFGYTRLDGAMRRSDRTNAIVSFQNDPGTTIILVSIKAGGVGYLSLL